MRRPNGTGTVVKLSGNRRKPFAVKIPTRDSHGNVVQKVLSCHATGRDAQAALDEYNANKGMGAAPTPDKFSMTVKNVYDLWSARKYAKAGEASITSYKASWARLNPLAALKMRDVTLDQLQAIIDQGEAAGLSKSSINNDKTLIRALYQFSMERDIVTKDYSAFLQMPIVCPKHEKGAFTDVQMRQLEDMATAGRPWADTILMLCYTGFRINEFLGLTPFAYDRDGDYLRGGMKTAAGRDRIVPVHPKIKKFLSIWLAKGGDTILCDDAGKRLSYNRYVKSAFAPIMADIGVPQATPHWCRHTFATRLHTFGAPDLERKRLLGHADKSVTEHYTHTDLEQLRAAIGLLA